MQPRRSAALSRDDPVKNAHAELLSPEPTVKYRGGVGECGRDEQLRAMAVLLGLGFES